MADVIPPTRTTRSTWTGSGRCGVRTNTDRGHQLPAGPGGSAGRGVDVVGLHGRARGARAIGHETSAYPKSFRPDGRVLYYGQMDAQGPHMWAIGVPGAGQGTLVFGTPRERRRGRRRPRRWLDSLPLERLES